MTAKLISLALGMWLFASAFLWPHSDAQLANAWVCGALVMTLSVWGLLGAAWARVLNAAVALWLMGSTLVMPRLSTATLWNQVLVGAVLLFVASLPTPRRPAVPAEGGRRPRRVRFI